MNLCPGCKAEWQRRDLPLAAAAVGCTGTGDGRCFEDRAQGRQWHQDHSAEALRRTEPARTVLPATPLGRKGNHDAHAMLDSCAALIREKLASLCTSLDAVQEGAR